jgi:hypothetical protein
LLTPSGVPFADWLDQRVRGGWLGKERILQEHDTTHDDAREPGEGAPYDYLGEVLLGRSPTCTRSE